MDYGFSEFATRTSKCYETLNTSLSTDKLNFDFDIGNAFLRIIHEL